MPATATKKGKTEGRLVPLGNNVLVERATAEEVTSGGIVLPETAKEKPQQGKVISIGEGRLLKDGGRARLGVSAGQKVIFRSHAGSTVKAEGKSFLILSEDDILAVLE